MSDPVKYQQVISDCNPGGIHTVLVDHIVKKSRIQNNIPVIGDEKISFLFVQVFQSADGYSFCGVFDDSFHLAWKPGYNLEGWTFFGRERYKESPMGGEILFPDKEREEMVSQNWAEQARNFGITFMICEQWPRMTTMERIAEHGMACGYKFRITGFETSATGSRVTVQNTGVAPIYYDAFVSINGVRAAESLKYLQPGETRQFVVKAGGTNPKLTIECDRLVSGQQIEYEAELQ